MFLVFNKSKIYSYIIALSMVVILFVTVAKIDEMVSPENETVETSTNLIENEMQNVVGQNEIQSNTINEVSKIQNVFLSE